MTATRRIGLVLAEDHKVVREGLRALLSSQPDLVVLAEVADGRDALAAVRRHEPQVLLTDLRLPGRSGLSLTEDVVRYAPGTSVIILSMYSAESFVAEALAKGARGYVAKDAGADEVIRAIREVSAGRRYVCASIARRAAEATLGTGASAAAGRVALTPREREVLSLTAHGLTAAQVADALGIGARTVETHRRHLMKKLGVSTHAGLVRAGVQADPLDSP